MKILLDSQMAIWLENATENVPRKMLLQLEDGANDIYLSVGSIWEIAIKRAKGKLDFKRSAFEVAQKRGYVVLPILAEHVEAAAALPPIHSDPFDRLLVAQARVEHLMLATTDAEMRKYAVMTL
jgi:PIN domain nuclease of toxin-antitoxin system